MRYRCVLCNTECGEDEVGMGRDFQKVCKDPFCGANVVPEPVGLVSRCYPAPDPKPQLSEEFDGDLGYSDIEISKLKLPPRPFRQRR